MEKNLEFYKDIYDNFPSMVLVGDHRVRKVTDCNRAFCQRLGYTKEEILDMEGVDLYHPDCRHLLPEIFSFLDKQGYLNNVEVSLRTKSGKKIPTSLSVASVFDENGAAAFSRVVLHDITDLTHAREELAEQARKFKEKSDELEKRNSDLNTFVHLVAHDLRAPLRVISSYTHLIKEDEDNQLSEESQGYIATLEKFTHKMGKMMNDIISYFVMNNETTKAEVVPLTPFIESVFELLPVPTGFHFEVQSDLTEIWVKKLPLQQVLHNLFNNAIKHHHQPSEGQISIHVREEENNYIFEVADNGPGVPSGFQEYIFEAFKTLKGKNEGSGLGLAIVKKMIQQEGGDIKLVSQEGQGSTFIIRWPNQKNLS